jgi:hypothetical protein
MLSPASAVSAGGQGISERISGRESDREFFEARLSVPEALALLTTTSGRDFPHSLSVVMVHLFGRKKRAIQEAGERLRNQGLSLEQVVNEVDEQVCAPFFTAESAEGDVFVCIGGYRTIKLSAAGSTQGSLNAAFEWVEVGSPGSPHAPTAGTHQPVIRRLGLSRSHPDLLRPCVLSLRAMIDSATLSAVLLYKAVRHESPNSDVKDVPSLPRHLDGCDIVDMVNVDEATIAAARVAASMVSGSDVNVCYFDALGSAVRVRLHSTPIRNGVVLCAAGGLRNKDLGRLVFAQLPAGVFRDHECWVPFAYADVFVERDSLRALRCPLLQTMFALPLTALSRATRAIAGRACVSCPGFACFVD